MHRGVLGLTGSNRRVIRKWGKMRYIIAHLTTRDACLGQIFHLPQITFEGQLHSSHTLQCLQFPIAPAYATTFNSCQGLTLMQVGIDLTHPVFSHGQLYTALSHTHHQSHAIVCLHPGEHVTFHDLLL